MKLKDGDLVAGRPVKILTDVEAVTAISIQAQDTDRLDDLYGVPEETPQKDQPEHDIEDKEGD